MCGARASSRWMAGSFTAAPPRTLWATADMRNIFRELDLARDDARAQRPAVHFRGTVVDPEGAGVAEDALDHSVARHAHAAQDLHRAVGDAGDRLGAHDLGHRALVRRPLAFV